jgi:hypothetical protein
MLSQTGSLLEERTMLTSVFHWLRGTSPRRRAGRISRRQPHSLRTVRRRSFALTVSLLEDRTLPSRFLVLNLDDSGDGSLRQAVVDAKAGGDQIAFAPGLQGTIVLTSGPLSITHDLLGTLTPL